MNQFLYKWVIPESLRNIEIPRGQVKADYGRLEGWVSIIANFLLFLSKLIVGLLVNSIALIADSIHSLSDVSTSVIVIIGYRISGKPADKEHPFGHERAEYITSLIIAIILGIAGFEFIKTSYHRLNKPQVQTITIGVIVFIILTILIKTWLGGFAKYIGQKIHSSALKAEALHHYTDTISSLMVLLAVIGSALGYPFLDGLGGIAVGLILIWAGFSIARDSADSLIGNPPSPEYVHQIHDICMSIDEVLNTHEIVVHSYGDNHFISLHVEVDQNLSSMETHNIGDKVKELLRNELNAYATVHVDPIDIHSKDVKKANKIVSEILSKSEQIKNFHDLRIIEQRDQSFIIFDIVPVSPKIKQCTDIKVCNKLRKRLKEVFPQHELQIEVDPVYSFNR